MVDDWRFFLRSERNYITLQLEITRSGCCSVFKMSAERNHIKVFVSSTVYDFEATLNKIFATLDSYGYDVYMSKEGTIPLDSRKSNLVNCVDAVDECDVFLGIVRPLVSSGILKKGEHSITFQEFERAYQLPIPHFVLADYRVEFAHKFLNVMGQKLSDIPYYTEKEVISPDGSVVILRKPNLVVHPECVELYRLAIQNHIRPASNRIGNWAQPFIDENGFLRFVESQFGNVERIKGIIDGR